MAPGNYSAWINILFSNETKNGFDIVEHMYTVALDMSLYPTVFWLLLVSAPFVATWIIGVSSVIPTVLYLTIGSVLVAVAPPELAMPARLMLMLGITGIIYNLYKGKK